jgi:hypothetical protein
MYNQTTVGYSHDRNLLSISARLESTKQDDDELQPIRHRYDITDHDHYLCAGYKLFFAAPQLRSAGFQLRTTIHPRTSANVLY